MDKSKTFNTDLVGTLETDFLIDIALRARARARSSARNRAARKRAPTSPNATTRTGSSTRWHGAKPTARPRLDYSRGVTITKFAPEVRTY